MTEVSDEVSDYMARIGAKGGKAGRGSKKSRGSEKHYAKLAEKSWVKRKGKGRKK